MRTRAVRFLNSTLLIIAGTLLVHDHLAAQNTSDYVTRLEEAATLKDFDDVFNRMIVDFRSGRLYFSDDQVLNIVEVTREKPFADVMLAKVYGWAGTMFGNGRMDEAIMFFMESATLYEKQHKNVAQALSYFEIALIQHKAENYEEAEEYYNKSLMLGGDSLDHRTRINCYNGLALIRRQEEKPDSAILGFRKAYEVAVEHRDTAWMGILAGNIGSVHLLNKKYDSSLYYYFRNLHFIRRTPEFENEIETYAHLGRVFLLKNDLDRAKKYLDSANAIIRDRKIKFNDFFNPMDDINESYALLYAAKGDHKRAFEYYKHFHQIDREKQQNVNGRSLKQLQSTFTYSKRQTELEMLRKVNEANLIALRQQKYAQLAFVSIIVLLTALIAIALRTGRQRKKMNRELFDSNTELERLNTIKDKLFSVISHDLRSPIANLQSVLALVKSGQLDKDEFTQISAKLSHQLEISGNALENLLQWARAQLSEVKATPEAITLYTSVDQVGREFMEDFTEKQIHFNNAIERGLMAWADKNQVEIIFRNLIGNAVKFTNAGGCVRVIGSITGDFVRIAVEDTGVGMTDAQQEKLFQPGQHFTTAGTNQEKGTGIGLLITREMIINNGGTVSVSSTKGKGTAITFTLPVFTPGRNQPV